MQAGYPKHNTEKIVNYFFLFILESLIAPEAAGFLAPLFIE